MRNSKIVIVGAGITGCFLAYLLAKKGFSVTVFEKFSLSELQKSSSNRSFNITFYGYAKRVFQKLKIWEKILPITTKLDGIVTQISYSRLTNFAPFNKRIPYYAIERSKLLQFLMDLARDKSVVFHFDCRVVAIDKQKRKLVIENKLKHAYSTVSADVIFGADGVHSFIRQMLQERQETAHRQEVSTWTYKQVRLSKEDVKALGLRENATHAWTKEDGVVISIPNLDKSHSAIFVLSQKNNNSFASLSSPPKIKKFLSKNFPALLPALPVITQAFLNHPEGHFINIYTTPWYEDDFMAIIGDSAHGFFPFYGQGTSAAIADVMELMRLIDIYQDDWGKIFPVYEKNRKPHTDVLADLSETSFVQYRRQKKGDYTAIYNRMQALLHNYFPKVFLPPLHALVGDNPTHAADYYRQYKSHTKLLNLLGFGVAVFFVTLAVSFVEDFVVIYSRRF